ncbi:hypothetical protein OG429_04265 [Streptomyces sp. NBC_00190]|uniref:hypothetical protein n=1 Tax=unclassified Streptomyces TaxID=2593676 RepID=UPI002E2CF8E4|nr:hypothetical protein [Streptomyces sp. NBC_00190]WSZ38606.1 hypothetical protein OG239_07270 [Streptomyces sp. NBC_00868]
MYEMRAESTPGGSEMLWHVIAKVPATGTLCGYTLAPNRTVTALLSEGAAERYCVPCMSAFRSAMESRTPREAAEPPCTREP